jgi:DNA-directed RNA polymerase
VCTVAGEWLQAQMDKLVVEEGRRAALKEYGTIRDAYHQARKLEAGYLAVRWDHRGRLNQADSALTYTSGSDLARSVLEFDEAKPVRTDAGRLALARHLINQYSGEDARSVTLGGELDWIHSHRGDIGRIADDCIMTDASHPLRLIAACRAWCAAERGEPIGLPVSIDATTSMLQHMALLLRDQQLARLSNLWPGERQDFYTQVAGACGSTRKVVKGVAMPMFYGQTDNSAMDVLRREGISNPRPLATRIHAEGAHIAPRAFALYEALRTVAEQLTAAGEPICWTTPSGWQCATDRRRAAKLRHTVELPDGAVRQYTEEVPGTKLHHDKQCNAITANLIHSLDASLLHLAVAALPKRVKSIAVAHDCFATHADDVPALRATLMQTLERMYRGSDLLASWWGVWAAQGVTVPCPERGTWSPQFVAGEYAFV